MKKTTYKLLVIVTIFVIAMCYYKLYIYDYTETLLMDETSGNQTITFKEYRVNPPTIKFQQLQRVDGLKGKIFKECNNSSTKNKVVAGTDYKNVRNIAIMIASSNKGRFNLGQICDIYDHCKNKWSYVDDPITSFISSASNTIAADYTGDCDDFAIVLSALILAVGGETRTNFGFSKSGGHAFTEVNLGSTELGLVEDYLRYRYKEKINKNFKLYGRVARDDSFWMNLDWFTDYPGGTYFPFEEGISYYPLQNFCEKF